MSIVDISNRPRRELIKLVAEFTGNTLEQIASLTDTELSLVASVFALHGIKRLTV